MVALVYGTASIIDSGLKVKQSYYGQKASGFNFIEKGLVTANPEYGEDIYAVSSIVVAFASLGAAVGVRLKQQKG